MMTSFVVIFYLYDVLSVCFEIRDEPYGGSLGPTLTVGPNIRLCAYMWPKTQFMCSFIKHRVSWNKLPHILVTLGCREASTQRTQ